MIFAVLQDSPSVIEELKRVAAEVDAPCLVVVEEAGKVGELTAAELERIGFRIAIYPGLGRYAAGYAIREALNVLKRDGNTKAARERMLTFKEYNEVLKLPEVEEWEQRYLR